MTVRYPQLQCDSHGIQPTGYVICEHIKTKNDVMHFELARMDDLGVICCRDCYTHKDEQPYALEHFITICARCAKDAGFTEIYA